MEQWVGKTSSFGAKSCQIRPVLEPLFFCKFWLGPHTPYCHQIASCFYWDHLWLTLEKAREELCPAEPLQALILCLEDAVAKHCCTVGCHTFLRGCQHLQGHHLTTSALSCNCHHTKDAVLSLPPSSLTLTAWKIEVLPEKRKKFMAGFHVDGAEYCKALQLLWPKAIYTSQKCSSLQRLPQHPVCCPRGAL